MRLLAGVLLIVCVSVSVVECRLPSFCRQFMIQHTQADSMVDGDDVDEDVEEEEEEFVADVVSDETSEDGEDVVKIAVEEIEMLNMFIDFMAYVHVCTVNVKVT